MTEFEIAKLQLRRGDMLVVRGKATISHDQRVKIGDTVRRALEKAGCDFVPVLVVDQNYSLEVVRTGENTPLPPDTQIHYG